MLDDPPLIRVTWETATGTRAPEDADLHRLVEFTFAVARSALGLPRFALLPSARASDIPLSDALTSTSLGVIDDIWD